MKKSWFLFPVFVIAALINAPASAANAISQSANGMVVIPSKNGIAVNAPSEGRACGKIFYNNSTTFVEDPIAACNNVNGAIPPNRVISFTDGTGNMVAARAAKIAPIPNAFLKAYLTRASTKSVDAGTFAFGEFRDPITFSNPLNEDFDVDVTRSFLTIFDSDEGVMVDGLHIGGSPGSDNAQFHAEMSSNLTGLLFALDLTYSAGQPLGVDVTPGAVSGQPGWDEMLLESTLRTLLDAGNPDNDFSLSNFSFPNIHLHVNAGQSLILFSSDLSTATAQAPEPAIVWLLALGMLIFAFIRSRLGASAIPDETRES